MHPIDIANEMTRDGHFDAARAIFNGLLEENPNDPRVLFNLGWFDCRDGNYKRAAERLDVGRYLNAYGCPPLGNGVPIWRGQGIDPLEGKFIHLRSEGGFGDEVINVRWAIELAKLGANVTVSASNGMCPVFARVAGVASVVRFAGAVHVHSDYWLPAMSGLNYFSPGREPYITACPAHMRKWKNLIRNTGKARVGIRWAGNPKFEHEQRRKFPPDMMIRLAEQHPQYQFYSLQRDDDLQDLPGDVIDLQSVLSTWEDTLAAICNLDLVISSCTSIAHLAAAAGVETLVVVPLPAYYTWAKPQAISDFYDCVTIYRQCKRGSWEEPFKQIDDELKRRAEIRRVG